MDSSLNPGEVDGISHVTVGLGWDPSTAGATEFDLDASAIALAADGRAPSRDFFVYFNNVSSPRGEIAHLGDNLTGEDEGDDEQIDIRLDLLSQAIVRLVFPVTIHDAGYRRQSFGDIRNAYIRVFDPADGHQIARYDLSNKARHEDAMVFGEMYRVGGSWAFRGLERPVLGGLTGIAREFGLPV